MKNQTRINICGVWVDSVTMDEAVEKAGELIGRREPSYIVTPNVDVIVKLQKDMEFRRIYEGAVLVVPDGMPLIWAGLFLGTPFQEKVSGSDLYVELCRVASQKGWKVFFMGAMPGVAEQAARILTQKMPELQVVGTYSPSFGFESNAEENSKIVNRIREKKPDILFVGLGSPKQEKWIDKYKNELGVPVSVSVGISFDYVAGTVKRAPLAFQKTGFEWLWRLAMEPKRLWKRYLLDDPKFFWMLLKQKFNKWSAV